jgi:hypothetical protein
MVHPGRIGVGLQFGQEFWCGGAYTCADRRILVSSRRKREFSDSTGTHGRNELFRRLRGWTVSLVCREEDRHICDRAWREKQAHGALKLGDLFTVDRPLASDYSH